MRLLAVLSELMQAAGTVDGITVPPRWGDRPPRPPTALVELPEEIQYDAGGRGYDRLPDVPLVVLCGDPTQPAAFRTAAAYADTGPGSVKTVMESYDYVEPITVRVASCTPDVADLAGTSFYVVIFHLDVAVSRT